MARFDVSQAAAHELLTACRLLFPAGAEQSRERVLAASEPTGVFVARAEGKLRAAALMQALPGALGVAWPPRGDSRQVEDAVTAAACDWLRSCGVKVCQAFALAGEEADMAPLERSGFRHTTRLVFLRRALGDEAVTPARRSEIVLAKGGAEFEAALLATHVGTLDCPELNAARTPADLLEGFACSPKSEWYLARREGEVIGVFSIAMDPSQRAEINYIGVVPEHRDRGFGSELLASAITRAALGGVSELTVSVDARNAPAMRLYARHGFVEYDGREVWLATWPA